MTLRAVSTSHGVTPLDLSQGLDGPPLSVNRIALAETRGDIPGCAMSADHLRQTRKVIIDITKCPRSTSYFKWPVFVS